MPMAGRKRHREAAVVVGNPEMGGLFEVANVEGTPAQLEVGFPLLVYAMLVLRVELLRAVVLDQHDIGMHAGAIIVVPV